VEADITYRESVPGVQYRDQEFRENECAMTSNKELRVGINGVSMLSPLTGIGQYTSNLVRELQEMHLSPWLFYGSDWRQVVRAQSMPGIGIAKNLFKRFIPRPYAASRFLMQRVFTRGIQQHRIQLYHEPNFMTYRFRGPAVVTVHDLSWVRHPETQPVDRVRQMNRYMPKTMQKAAHILVDSDFIRNEVIEHFGVCEDRVSTTLLGVGKEFRPIDEPHCAPILQRYGLQFGHYILAVATLEPRKNLTTLIAAFSQLPQAMRRNYPLVIVGMRGWGEKLISPSLRQMIACGEVRLTGFVPQKDLPFMYSGARVFVYPSLYEGFGLPPLEAMACGVPVIVSNRASLPEVVGDAGILIEPLDDSEIAEQMRTVIEDEMLHRHLSGVGRQRSHLFTWRKCALETLAVYRRVLETHQP
jgi:glycosyltransferase involved in cell wall biosynthesis